MSEKNTKEKSNTVIKIVDTVLGIGIVVSVVFNVYQFNSNNILKSEIDTIEADIEALGNENSTLDKDIEASKNTLSRQSTQIEELDNTIKGLEADNKNLTESLEELQKKSEEIRLSKEKEALDEEMNDTINKILAENNKSNTQTYTEYQGPHVGTPSTGDLGDYVFGQGDYSEGAGAQVY